LDRKKKKKEVQSRNITGGKKKKEDWAVQAEMGHLVKGGTNNKSRLNLHI